MAHPETLIPLADSLTPAGTVTNIAAADRLREALIQAADADGWRETLDAAWPALAPVAGASPYLAGLMRRRPAHLGRLLNADPVEALERIGIPADSVADIILTHLHYDHAGNLDRFPNATIHLQDAEMNFATGRCMCHATMRHPYDVEDVVSCVRRVYADRARFYEGDAEIFPGISVHLLPGHSKGLQSVRVETARGPILLASDASHYYANFQREAPFAITVDVAATLRSYRRMRELVADETCIVPGHDPLVGERYPSRTVGGVELLELHLSLSPAPVETPSERR